MRHLIQTGLHRPAHFRRLWPALLIFLVPSLAQAHPGTPGHTHGLADGWCHPFTGLDHLCTMVAVGLWSGQRGGKMPWVMPVTFVSLMIIGGVLGIHGVAVPVVEQGVAASVLVAGLFLAAAVRLPMIVSALMAGNFGLFHGYAHGLEMPETVSGLAYALGFAAATASLLFAGVGLGLLARRFDAVRLVRLAGGVIATMGAYLCFAGI